MPKTEIDPDVNRYRRYQSVIDILLTTGDKLVRREGRPYESASELLACIKSEREAKPTSRKNPWELEK